MNEIWKDIPGYNGLYQVSNLGNVRTYRIRGSKHGISDTPTLKTQRLLDSGNNCCYYAVDLFNGDRNTKKTFRTHVLVAMGFKEYEPNGFEFVVDHIDNNKLNNHVDNIQIVPQRVNTTKDKKNKGVHQCNKTKKWTVIMRLKQFNNNKLYFGSYDTIHEAIIVRNRVIENIDKYEDKDQFRKLVCGYDVINYDDFYNKKRQMNMLSGS
jgi:hypothetical protein